MKRLTVIRIVSSTTATLAILVVLLFSLPLEIVQLVFPERCDLTERRAYDLPGNGGYSIEYLLYYDYDCVMEIDFAEYVMGVRSRSPWPWPETTHIFLYDAPKDHAVNIIPSGPNTVTLSAQDLTKVIVAETQWGALKIEYNIRSIKNPQPTDPVTTGDGWAEKEQRLEQRARSQGIPLMREWFPE
jgi:hypothetical protein